jgi:prepilin-type processing-associated H-X9-DG protein
MSEIEPKSPKIRLPEVLLVIVIIGLFLGWMIPSVQTVQTGAGRTKCANNLKQIILAVHSAHDVQKEMPPLFGPYAEHGTDFSDPKGPPWQKTVDPGAAIWYHILPCVEEKAVYNHKPPGFDYQNAKIYLGTTADGTEDNAAAFKVPVYMCPQDESVTPGVIRSLTGGALGNNVTVYTWDGNSAHAPAADDATKTRVWGTNSYAANWMVFAGLPAPRRLDQIVDGTSKTIFFTEKITACDTPPALMGGNLWAMPPFFASGTQANPPVFNFAGEIGFTGVLAKGAPDASSYTGALFQTRPAVGQCDPTLASSPHTGGMNVALGDGSVKFISSTVSQATWQAALTPGPIEGFSTGYPRSDAIGRDWGD